MKIFISQKMRNKTHEEIIKERNAILNGYLLHGNTDAKIKKEVDAFKNKLLNEETFTQSFMDAVFAFHGREVGDIVIDLLQSYKPKLKHKSPIDALSHSLAMLDEADIVLVPKKAKENVTVFTVKILNWNSEFSLLRGCEFEFLIAKSYGKKVYTYDDNYTFEEV